MARKKTAQAKEPPMQVMREQYKRAVDADRDMRELAVSDHEFVTIPGAQWDSHQKLMRGNRPNYEFPILRSHWRQVCNDQKKARPSIKVRPVENGDAKGADLRQGLIRNIEQTSNADWAYDNGFETLVSAGMGAWLVKTAYSTDDAWDQDFKIERIDDPLNSVWMDPDDQENPAFGFIERTMTREAFKAAYPDAQVASFESEGVSGYDSWFGQDSIRVVAWYRQVPESKVISLLSDGRSVDEAQLEGIKDELQEQGVTVLKSRTCKSHKIVMSICSGMEEIDGPHDLVFHRIPIVVVYGNRMKFNGQWHYCGMVRFSRDPQRLLNYNLTTAQEAVAKVPKSPYLATPAMMEGKGVMESWQKAAATDPFLLVYTPDPKAPQGRPVREPPPAMPAALLTLTQTAVDMLKASDGIYDASVGARSNETSGIAIQRRQEEGDTATFDYQDSLEKGIQVTGDLLLRALPKVIDTPRIMRVIGKDGTEKLEPLYQEVRDEQTGQMKKINDLSFGKYDVTVKTGPNYDTLRTEFVDVLSQLGQANPLIAQATPDLLVKALDFPGAEEAGERMKLLLPPPIQQSLQQGKELPPEVQQAMQQAEQMMQQAQQMGQELQQAAQQLEQEKQANAADKQSVQAQKSLLSAEERRIEAELRAQAAEAHLADIERQAQAGEREDAVEQGEQAVEQESQALMAAQAVIEQAVALSAAQTQLMAEMRDMMAMTAQPKPAMAIVRDETGRVIGAQPVEQL